MRPHNVSFGFTIAAGDNSDIVVSRIDHDTPADTAGLRVGDHVVRVNGYDVTAANLPDVASLVRCVDGNRHRHIVHSRAGGYVSKH